MSIAPHLCGPDCGHITRFTDRRGVAGAGASGRRAPLVKTKALEDRYARQLRKVAAEVGRIVDGFPDKSPTQLPLLMDALRRYSEIVEPWATTVADVMLREVEARDRRGWVRVSEEVSRGLARELRDLDVGATVREMLAGQVKLIKSLPIEAGERVHRLTMKALEVGTRADEIAAEIMRSGEVTASRATLIARTEVARTASGLVQARSMAVGITSYIWRTTRDEITRKSHHEMEGVAVQWDKPPMLSDGMAGHAGQFPNCRCWPEPVLPVRF